MKYLNQKFNTLIHRHPWALQAGLALGIAVLAITVSWLQSPNAKAEVIPDQLFTITHPAAGEKWVAEDTDKKIEITFNKALASTESISLAFDLCKNRINLSDANPTPVCFGGALNSPNPYVISGPKAVGATVSIPWEKVGYDISGTLLAPNDGTWVNNAFIMAEYPDIGQSQTIHNIPSEIFSIVYEPHITSIEPASGKTNQVITITGLHFGAEAETNHLIFNMNGTDYESMIVQKWTGTSITAAVPTSLPAGTAKVKVVTAAGTSEEVNFVITSTPLSATYYSQPKSVVNVGLGPNKLVSFQAKFSQAAAGSDVAFAIGFFKADGITPVYSSSDDSSIIDSNGVDDGYLPVPPDQEIDQIGADYTLVNYPLPNSLDSKVSQVSTVRFRIIMSTTDTGASAQPWVEKVGLMYDPGDVNSIGMINITDPSDGTKTIDRGLSGTFNITVTPASGYSGTVALAVGPITLVGGNGQAITTITHEFSETSFELANNVAKPVTLTFTVPNDPTLSGVYRFDITGHDTTNTSRILSPATDGQINIPTTSTPVTLAVTPASNSAIKGGAAVTYTVTAARSSGTFLGSIALTSNIGTVFGTGVTASFNPTSINFTANDVASPGSPILSKTSTLTVTAQDTATVTEAKTFTVNGAIANLPDVTATAQLAIITSADAITLNLSIPVEGGKPADANAPHPKFTLRLYNGLVRTLEKTGLSTNAQNNVAVTLTRTELPAGTYTAYARSTRHLWSKSTQANVVIDATTTKDLTFPTLKVGDVDVNNKINMQDLSLIWVDYGKTLLGLLGDFNNDGKINITGDVSYILQHYSLFGDKLPDETR